MVFNSPQIRKYLLSGYEKTLDSISGIGKFGLRNILSWKFIFLLILVPLGWLTKPETGVSAAGKNNLTRIDFAQDMAATIESIGINHPLKRPAKTFIGMPFQDVSPEQWNSLEPLLRSDLISGFPDRTFRPSDPIRWGEVLLNWGRMIESFKVFMGNEAVVENRGKIPANWAWLESKLVSMERLGLIDDLFLSKIRSERVADLLGMNELIGMTVRVCKERIRHREFPETASADSTSSSFSSLSPFPSPSITNSAIAIPMQTAAALKPTANSETETEPTSQAWFSVSVLNSITRKPVENIQLVVNGRELIASPDGLFRLPNTGSGEKLEMLFAADGYKSLQMKYKPGTKKQVQILLKPIRAICKLSVVSAADGKPVRIFRALIDGQAGVVAETGSVVFRTIKPGYHNVEIAAAGFLDERKLLFVEEDGTNRTMRLQPRFHD